MAELSIQQAMELALGHFQAGRWDKAGSICQQILASYPRETNAMNLLGLCALRSGKAGEAYYWFDGAAQIEPAAEFHYNKGLALAELKNLDEAITAYRRALEQKPDYALAYNALGAALRVAGKLQEAADAFGAAVRIKPDYSLALRNLGGTLTELGRAQEAIPPLGTALQLKPDDAVAHNNLGNALAEAGQRDRAIEEFEIALRLRPDLSLAHNNLGNARKDQGRLGDAIACFKKALEFEPDYAAAHNNLGNMLIHTGRIREGLDSIERWLATHPGHAGIDSNRLYSLHFLEREPAEIFAEHRRWNTRHAAPLKKFIEPHQNDPAPDRQLRIGYVSADLHEHSVAYFAEPLLANHNAHEVEVFCYADVARPDAATGRIKKSVHQWRSIRGMDDAAVARQIREDGIDILIDLAGHSSGNRLLVFARKPAPVQVTYLGYPDTTGMDAMDYRLTDAKADPPGMTEAFHSETLVRLPETFLCFGPEITAEKTAHAKGHSVTFASFNSLPKLGTGTIELWARILNEMPESRLVLKNQDLADDAAKGYVIAEFAKYRVAADRLELRGWEISRAEHLKLYQRVDIGLDTHPYNGTTTTCEAMWMGVPVVTLAGRTHAARVGVSLLGSVGLDDLIAQNPDEYVEIALRLARDLPRLRQLQAGLRNRMAASPLRDERGFAERVEAAYRIMWRSWCAPNAIVPSPGTPREGQGEG